MKYKAGAEVYLPDDTFYELYKNKPLKVIIVDGKNKRYHFKDGLTLYEDDIDHEKTAELNESISFEEMEEELDTVNHPPHYTQGDIETIDIIKILTQGYTGYEGSLVGNVIKYIARANFKGNKAEDIQKSQFYLNKLVEELVE